MKNNITILTITGAAREGNQTGKLAELSKKYFKDLEVDYIVFDIQEKPLPIYDGNRSLQNENVQEFLNLAKAADGIVLVSPEYHGSMSGAIKNALDWLDFLEDIDFLAGKVIGIMGGGGSFGNSGAAIQLMMTIRALHGWLMPDVLVNIPKIGSAFDIQGDLIDQSLQKRLNTFSQKMVKYTQMFKENREVFVN